MSDGSVVELWRHVDAPRTRFQCPCGGTEFEIARFAADADPSKVRVLCTTCRDFQTNLHVERMDP